MLRDIRYQISDIGWKEGNMTAEFSIGQHVGDYDVISILGAGGMGKVYKVRNVIADRVEAMKVLLPDLNSSQSLADRFLREIRLLATLSHPNIAALRTALTFENQLVMILEFVEGETLANRLARAPLSTAETVSYAEQILSALSYAHKQNIIHRDIKPANMMLTPQGVVKLMDFGIARSATDGSLTSTGTTLGSLNYMPPEQVRGEAADARSDIYSFGVSLYEMLTGKLPFHSDSQYSLMSAHLNQPPPPPITLRGDLPPGLNEIILMAMAKDPTNRFQSADAFRAALSSVPVSAPPASGTTTLMETPSTARVPAAPPASRPAVLPTAPMPAPTMPMTSPAAPAAAAMPPPPARPSGSRTVWLALGVLLGIGVVAAAAVYVPRHLGTHANPSKAAFSSKGADSSPNNAATADTSAQAQTAAAQDNSAPNASSAGASAQASQDKTKSDTDTNATTDTTAAASKDATPPAKADKRDRSSGNPTPARAGDTLQQTSAAPAPPPGPSPEEIAKVEDDADKLNIRAAAASRSVDTLRQQQEKDGYNLRGDIAAAQERMQNYLTKGNNALNVHDLKNAQKYFDLADAELTKLEKFLGH